MDQKNNKEVIEELEEPLRIRAHTLLCLQGYHGLGYSDEFIAEMDRVTKYLRENPHALIKVVASADMFCLKCPHHNRGRCMIDDPEDQPVPMDTPDKSTLMDRRVLSWLGIEKGSEQIWKHILVKIGLSVDSSVMDILCGDCCWREYPHCANALDDLYRKVTGKEPLFS